jgi:hypothetical protein
MPDKPEKEKKPEILEWIKPPQGAVEIYANNIHITWTLDDVRVRLAQVVTSPKTPNPGTDYAGANEERAAVTFSWRNAKLLLNQLAQVIKLYEEANGEIKTDIKLPLAIDATKQEQSPSSNVQ